MEKEKIDCWQADNMLWYAREAHSSITFIGRSKQEVEDKVRNAIETTKQFKKKK
jgi:hypothetical protein